VRVDLLLKALCLVKSRSRAQKGCEAGFISINGRKAKPSAEARPGDVIEIRYPRGLKAIEILEAPAGQVGRKDCERYYRVIRESSIEGGSSEEWDV
jgi:ribosomal 50S subunit-recycling heat shock protein